jgi:4-amino-4-deoxy-L-arabinose transferase-like glycosyltransferase
MSFNQLNNKNVTWPSIFLIVIVLITLGCPTLVYPFGRDQGEYAWIATSTLNGNLSYRDIFNVKPPLTHVVHQLALLLFGYSMASIRILDLLWQGLTAIIIFMIAKQIKQPSAASVLASILYLFSYYRMDFWTTAQTDGFLTLPLALGIFFYLQAQQRSNHPWLYSISGAAIGLAVLFKYPIGIMIVFMFILSLINLKKSSILPTLLLGVGFLFPLIITVLTMFIRGNLTDFLLTQFTYILKYSTILQQNVGYKTTFGASFLIAIISSIPGWVSIFNGFGLFHETSYHHFMNMAIISMWFIAAVIHFIIQNKFYTYHMLPMLAPIALMLSNYFFNLFKTQSRILFTVGALGGILAIALVIFPFFISDFPQKYIRLWSVAIGNSSLQTMYGNTEFDVNGPNKDFSSRADMEVAEYFITHTKKDEKIYIWGFEPSIYFLSQRTNATRFPSDFVLYGPNASPEWRLEFITEIKTEKPVYIAIVKYDNMFFVTGSIEDSWEAYNSFDKFHDFVIKNYHLETIIEDFTLYRLN